MPAEVDRQKRDKRRHNPEQSDGSQRAPMSDQSVVVQRTADVDVPVETDGTQVQYRRRRAHDVGRHPHPAGAMAEYPPAKHVVDDGERHYDGGDQRVGQRQRHDEIVAGPTKVSVRYDGHND